jgi:hypothetical protein
VPRKESIGGQKFKHDEVGPAACPPFIAEAKNIYAAGFTKLVQRLEKKNA